MPNRFPCLVCTLFCLILLAFPSAALSADHGHGDQSPVTEESEHSGSRADPMAEGTHGDDHASTGHEMAMPNSEGGEGGDTDHSGHEMDGDMVDHSPEAHKAAADAAAREGAVGIEEKLGGQVADAVFRDADGNSVVLSELVDVPTVILPVYYRCPDVCHILQGSFAQILPKVDLEPGKDIQIISLGFDPREDAEDAARIRRNVETQLAGKYPIRHWKFLSGDQASINEAMDSIGFSVQRQGGIYAHPVGAVVVAPGGKVVRYLYGSSFLPFDVTMAATEAAEGKTGLSIKRMLAFCYNYDPQGRRYVFDIMRVSGVGILGGLLLLLGVLLFAGKKKKRGRE